MLQILVPSLQTLTFSNVYTITVTGAEGSNLICNVDGNIDSFKITNAGKYVERTQPATIITPNATTKTITTLSTQNIEAQIRAGFMRSIAASYGLQEGLKLWSATITPQNKIDDLNIAEFEKQCIKDHYDAYVSAAVMPKYATMLAGVGVAVWAYISPYVMKLLGH